MTRLTLECRTIDEVYEWVWMLGEYGQPDSDDLYINTTGKISPPGGYRLTLEATDKPKLNARREALYSLFSVMIRPGEDEGGDAGLTELGWREVVEGLQVLTETGDAALPVWCDGKLYRSNNQIAQQILAYAAKAPSKQLPNKLRAGLYSVLAELEDGEVEE